MTRRRIGPCSFLAPTSISIFPRSAQSADGRRSGRFPSEQIVKAAAGWLRRSRPCRRGRRRRAREHAPPASGLAASRYFCPWSSPAWPRSRSRSPLRRAMCWTSGLLRKLRQGSHCRRREHGERRRSRRLRHRRPGPRTWLPSTPASIPTPSRFPETGATRTAWPEICPPAPLPTRMRQSMPPRIGRAARTWCSWCSRAFVPISSVGCSRASRSRQSSTPWRHAATSSPAACSHNGYTFPVPVPHLYRNPGRSSRLSDHHRRLQGDGVPGGSISARRVVWRPA